MMNKNKNELRQRIRRERKALSCEQQLFAATQVYTHITHLNRYRLSQHIAFYVSAEGELDCTLLIQHAHQAGKHCYLPVLHPQKIDTLAFLPYAPGDRLIANRFGILEPVVDYTKNHYPAWQLELVFTPLVAFDKQRNRLGMGKGYYDRTFAFLNDAAHKPYLVGLAYQMQQVDHLITEAHDVPLDIVVTEKSIIT
jgi:5-formyltetrahydrofolate cyclo-ligase